MKIARYDLIRATDNMLKAIGVRRKSSRGWLWDAVHSEFRPEDVAEFYCLKKIRESRQKTGWHKTDFRPVRKTDGEAERFANALYEQSGRDLS